MRLLYLQRHFHRTDIISLHVLISGLLCFSIDGSSFNLAFCKLPLVLLPGFIGIFYTLYPFTPLFEFMHPFLQLHSIIPICLSIPSHLLRTYM